MSSMTNVSTALPKKEKATKYKDMNQLSTGANLLWHILLIFGCLCVIVPLWIVIVASFTDNATLLMHGHKSPKVFSVSGFNFCCHQVADPCGL